MERGLSGRVGRDVDSESSTETAAVWAQSQLSTRVDFTVDVLGETRSLPV